MSGTRGGDQGEPAELAVLCVFVGVYVCTCVGVCVPAGDTKRGADSAVFPLLPCIREHPEYVSH